VICSATLGRPVTSGLPCGNINPLGITGTPVVDLASRSLFLDAMIDGATKKHFIYSFERGDRRHEFGFGRWMWTPPPLTTAFLTSLVQTSAAAWLLVNGRVYVSYSGTPATAASIRGWVVGVKISTILSCHGLATTAIGGGIWGHGGVEAMELTCSWSPATRFGTGGVWSGGEAIIRLQAGPLWTGQPTD